MVSKRIFYFLFFLFLGFCSRSETNEGGGVLFLFFPFRNLYFSRKREFFYIQINRDETKISKTDPFYLKKFFFGDNETGFTSL